MTRLRRTTLALALALLAALGGCTATEPDAAEPERYCDLIDHATLADALDDLRGDRDTLEVKDFGGPGAEPVTCDVYLEEYGRELVDVLAYEPVASADPTEAERLEASLARYRQDPPPSYVEVEEDGVRGYAGYFPDLGLRSVWPEGAVFATLLTASRVVEVTVPTDPNLPADRAVDLALEVAREIAPRLDPS